MKKWKNDLCLILGLLVLAGALWLGIRLTREAGGEAVVTVAGREVGRYSLAEEREVPIESDGGRNLLVIREGAAAITEADCPDKICVHTGEIQYTGETIVCLPHQVVVEIVGGADSGIDTVSR